MKDLPSYPTIVIGEFEDAFSESVEHGTDLSSSYVLRVGRPTLTDAPPPPQNYYSVLKDTWKKPEFSVRFNLEKVAKSEDVQELTDDDSVLKKYLNERVPHFSPFVYVSIFVV